MEHYEKGDVKELEDHVHMQCVLDNAIHMKVNAGSKIHNLMKFAEKKMNVRFVYSFITICFCFFYMFVFFITSCFYIMINRVVIYVPTYMWLWGSLQLKG